MSLKRILVVAGSDSSGGAGLEADQKVIAAHGCYAMTATTALTAQNTKGVFDIHQVPSRFMKTQIDACIEDIGVDVIKTGMLASRDKIDVVADAIEKYQIPLSVIDPVMVSTSGAILLPEIAVDTLIKRLLPLTTVLTPNLPEAQMLLTKVHGGYAEPKSCDDLVQMAKDLQKLGPKYVLLKGGHIPLTREKKITKNKAEYHIVFNVLVGADVVSIMESDFLNSKNTHGTGCSLASAIASNLATGMTVEAAVKAGGRYVEAGIKTSIGLGKGNGPINHFHSIYYLPFSPGHFIEYLLEREDVVGPWKEHTEHEFVKQIGDGTLPVEKFKMYLIQDYLYLIQYARAHALASYKAKLPKDMRRSNDIVRHIYEELKMHIAYCAEYGLSEEEMMKYEEKQACTAYTRYVLDIGNSEDWFALQIALFPCLLGYHVIAKRLSDDPATVREGNQYWKWICTYVAEDYTEAVKLGCELIEEHAVLQSPSRIEDLARIFTHATNMETGFWDMGAVA